MTFVLPRRVLALALLALVAVIAATVIPAGVVSAMETAPADAVASDAGVCGELASARNSAGGGVGRGVVGVFGLVGSAETGFLATDRVGVACCYTYANGAPLVYTDLTGYFIDDKFEAAWDATGGKVVTAVNNKVVKPVRDEVVAPFADWSSKQVDAFGSYLAATGGAAVDMYQSTANAVNNQWQGFQSGLDEVGAWTARNKDQLIAGAAAFVVGAGCIAVATATTATIGTPACLAAAGATYGAIIGYSSSCMGGQGAVECGTGVAAYTTVGGVAGLTGGYAATGVAALFGAGSTSILAGGTALGAGGAVEATIFSAGQQLIETGAIDPKILAQAGLSGFGFGAALGGITRSTPGSMINAGSTSKGPNTARPSEFNRTESLSGRPSSRQVVEIAESMRADGWQGPPIKVVDVDGALYVVDGHHRIAAATQAGLGEVPYSVVDPATVVGPGQWGSVEEIVRDSFTVGPDRLRK